MPSLNSVGRDGEETCTPGVGQPWGRQARATPSLLALAMIVALIGHNALAERPLRQPGPPPKVLQPEDRPFSLTGAWRELGQHLNATARKSHDAAVPAGVERETEPLKEQSPPPIAISPGAPEEPREPAKLLVLASLEPALTVISALPIPTAPAERQSGGLRLTVERAIESAVALPLVVRQREAALAERPAMTPPAPTSTPDAPSRPPASLLTARLPVLRPLPPVGPVNAAAPPAPAKPMSKPAAVEKPVARKAASQATVEVRWLAGIGIVEPQDSGEPQPTMFEKLPRDAP